MFRLFLLGIFIVLFIGEKKGCRDGFLIFSVIRFCNRCDHFDGAICHGGMKSCWKFNVYSENKSCATNHYYYSDRFSGTYLFRYTTLNCKVCEEGMLQLFHDLLRETHCCTDRDRGLYIARVWESQGEIRWCSLI
uniref:Prostate and testis expressed 2 n=1 Tax=Oryctolagus cuniculus TaxID=9986 RepID=A0A5F9DGB4_RABIT